MRRTEHPGLVVRQKSPLNLDFQFATLSDWLTPVDQYYVRSHFPAPTIAAKDWCLHVEGAVETSLA